MPGTPNFLDDVANDLAIWIDQTASQVALAFAPARAPFSANVSEEQKLLFYKARLFNPDGSPNAQGRAEEIARLGAEGFGHVLKQVVRRWPELAPPEPEPIAVPQEWPSVPPPPGAGPPGLPPGPPGPPGLPMPPPPGPLPGGSGPPMPAGPQGPPLPPMMPPPR